MEAFRTGKDLATVEKEVRQAQTQLRKFVEWLGKSRIRGEFTTPESLKAEILASLKKWHPVAAASGIEKEQAEAEEKYFEYLRDQCGWIDLRGIMVGDNRAHRVPIEQIYLGQEARHPERPWFRQDDVRASHGPGADAARQLPHLHSRFGPRPTHRKGGG